MDLLRAEAQQSLSNYREQLSAANSAAEKAQIAGFESPACPRAGLPMLGDDEPGKPCDAKPLCEEASKLNTQSGDQLGSLEPQIRSQMRTTAKET